MRSWYCKGWVGLGFSTRVSFRFTDSAKLKSSTYFMCMAAIGVLFFIFPVIFEPIFFSRCENPAPLISMRKMNNPNLVPWGPPPGRGCLVELHPLCLTIMSLSVRNPATILSSHPGTPISLSRVIIKLSKPNATQLNPTLKQLALELDIVVTCTPPPHPQTFQPLLDQLES